MKLDKGIPVQFGEVKATVFGGPFNSFSPDRRLVGIKMAVEIKKPCDFALDTKDFSVPSQELMQEGVKYGLQKILEGNDIYVGCMGGIGRTGLYMACMAKVMFDYNTAPGTAHYKEEDPTTYDPVAYVRRNYSPGNGHVAIETKAQEQFVVEFDTGPALTYLRSKLEPKVSVRTVAVSRVVEKIVYVWNPFVAVSQWFR